MVCVLDPQDSDYSVGKIIPGNGHAEFRVRLAQRIEFDIVVDAQT